MQRLGRNWKRLHQLAYAAGVFAVLHFLWQAKAAERWEPLLYAVGLGLLLFVRIPRVRHAIVRWRTGLRSERPAAHPAAQTAGVRATPKAGAEQTARRAN
jgi:sulfoxide reductase heme-binding subunit YedZ